MKYSYHSKQKSFTPESYTRMSIRRKNGFTILEVILAIAIMAMLIGSVFTIANSSTLLSQSVVDNQKEYRHKASFEGYFESLFFNLPHDARFDLSDGDNGFQSLTIENPNTHFPSLENDQYADAFNASIVKNRDGLLELKTTWSIINESEFNETEQKQSLTLIGDITSFEWQIYSVKDKIWYSTWSTELARPSHVRIIYSTTSAPDENIRTFWIPPSAIIQ